MQFCESSSASHARLNSRSKVRSMSARSAGRRRRSTAARERGAKTRRHGAARPSRRVRGITAASGSGPRRSAARAGASAVRRSLVHGAARTPSSSETRHEGRRIANLCSRRVCARHPAFRAERCVLIGRALGRWHALRAALVCGHHLYHLVLMAYVLHMARARTLTERGAKAAGVRRHRAGDKAIYVCAMVRGRGSETWDGAGEQRERAARAADDDWRRISTPGWAAVRATRTVGARTPAIPRYFQESGATSSS
jgi:hypothetical protein